MWSEWCALILMLSIRTFRPAPEEFLDPVRLAQNWYRAEIVTGHVLVQFKSSAVARVKRIVSARSGEQNKLLFLLRGIQKDQRREKVSGLAETRVDSFFIESLWFLWLARLDST